MVDKAGGLRPAVAETPSASPSALHVSNADNGATLQMVVGESLMIDLTAPEAGEIWQEPKEQAQGPLYLAQLDVGDARTTAAFDAIGPSSAYGGTPDVIRATSDRKCAHEQPACQFAPQTWQVSVLVEGEQPSTIPVYPCSSPTATPSPRRPPAHRR
ncbi:MAG: hypothetical protein ABR520_03445 [Mycobacteriales bacterium]|nr:hypothetical protein [Frankia sp.]